MLAKRPRRSLVIEANFQSSLDYQLAIEITATHPIAEHASNASTVFVSVHISPKQPQRLTLVSSLPESRSLGDDFCEVEGVVILEEKSHTRINEVIPTPAPVCAFDRGNNRDPPSAGEPAEGCGGGLIAGADPLRNLRDSLRSTRHREPRNNPPLSWRQ